MATEEQKREIGGVVSRLQVILEEHPQFLLLVEKFVALLEKRVPSPYQRNLEVFKNQWELSGRVAKSLALRGQLTPEHILELSEEKIWLLDLHGLGPGGKQEIINKRKPVEIN